MLEAGMSEIMALGSGGGGSLYAVPVPVGAPVYLLKPGEIRNGCYYPPLGSTSGPAIIAPSFGEFLYMFVSGLKEFVWEGVSGPFA